MTAKDYKRAIEDSATAALEAYPACAEMRSRLFLSMLAGVVKYHDEALGARLTSVWRSTVAPDSASSPAGVA